MHNTDAQQFHSLLSVTLHLHLNFKLLIYCVLGLFFSYKYIVKARVPSAQLKLIVKMGYFYFEALEDILFSLRAPLPVPDDALGSGLPPVDQWDILMLLCHCCHEDDQCVAKIPL